MSDFKQSSGFRYMMVLIILGHCLTLIATNAVAESDSGKEDYFVVEVGIFYSDIKTEFRDSSNKIGVGSLINLEEDLGFDNSEAIVQLKLTKHFAQKHKIIVTIQESSRNASTVSDKPILVGDTIFPPGTQLDSKLDLLVYKIVYGYSFYQSPKVDLAFLAGVIVLDPSVQILSSIDNEESGGAIGFPSFGLELGYKINKEFNVNVSGEFFEISTSSAEADVFIFHAGIDYRLTSRIKIGLRYSTFELEGQDIEDNDELDMSYDGPMVFVNFTI